MKVSPIKSRPITIFLSACLLLSGCATQAPATIDFNSESMEKTIEVVLAESNDYPKARITADRDPRFGTSLDFDTSANPGASITTYVYLVGSAQERSEIEILRNLDKSFLSELEAAKTQGIYSEITGLEAEATPFEVEMIGIQRVGLKRGHHAVRGQDIQSFTYLFYREPFAIKYRASFYLDEKLQGESANEAFADAIVRATLPKIKATWPEGCRLLNARGEGNAIYINPEWDKEKSAQELVRQVGQVNFNRARNGCSDLEDAMLLQRIAAKKLESELKK